MANFNVDIGDAGLAVEQSVAPPSYTLAGAFGNAINTYNRGQSKGSTRAPTEDEQLGLYLKSAGEATDGLSGTNASVQMQEVIVKLRRNGIILSSDSASIFEAQFGVNPNGFMGDAEEQAEQDYQLQYSAAASDSSVALRWWCTCLRATRPRWAAWIWVAALLCLASSCASAAASA